MALGARYLAMIWDSAWEQGGGDTQHDLGECNRDTLKEFYENTKFVESHTIDEIGAVLGAEGNFSGDMPAMGPAIGAKKTAVIKVAKKPAAKRPSRKSRKPRSPTDT